MSDRYVLNHDHTVTKMDDLIEWAYRFENDDRRLVQEVVNGYTVSTVFLGIDHNFGDGDSPLLFETMVFPVGSFDEQFCERCSTYEQAMVMHTRGKEWAMKAPTPPPPAPKQKPPLDAQPPAL